LDEPVSCGGESADLSALDLSTSCIWTVQTGALGKLWEVESV
jgi:hypothetical protein